VRLTISLALQKCALKEFTPLTKDATLSAAKHVVARNNNNITNNLNDHGAIPFPSG